MNTSATIISKHKGYELYQLLLVDSTNNYAAKLLGTKALSDFTVIMAHNQTNGRGQRGNEWQSEAGENMTVSVILKDLNIPHNKHFYLSMAVALSVHDLLKWFIKSVVWLKWPNDIYIYEKKIGGILIENTLQNGCVKNAIIGLGINVNQVNFGAQISATSLALETKLNQPYNIVELIHQWIPHLKHRLKLLADKDFVTLKQDYLKRLLWRNTEQCYMYKGDMINATITDVKENGMLVLVTRGGSRIEADLKEIKKV